HVADLTPQLGEAVLVEVGNSSVVDQHGAVVRGQQSHHVLQQHALARTGTSQQHRGAGVGNIEAHAAEHDAIAKALDDIVEADHSSTTAQNASSTRIAMQPSATARVVSRPTPSAPPWVASP